MVTLANGAVEQIPHRSRCFVSLRACTLMCQGSMVDTRVEPMTSDKAAQMRYKPSPVLLPHPSLSRGL